MLNLLILASLSAPPTLSPAALRDLQCLTLTLGGVGAEKDESKLQAAIAESWYYLGRLDVSAPGLNLLEALKYQAKAMESEPRLKEIGAACDSQVAARGRDLVKIGEGETPSKARP